MTETTVFTQTPSVETPPVIVTPTAPVISQELSEFVGTGKKYATLEDALKSVPHAQTHISKIEQELAQAKEELLKRKTTEELLEELRVPGVAHATTTAVSTTTQNDIKQLVSDVLQVMNVFVAKMNGIRKYK